MKNIHELWSDSYVWRMWYIAYLSDFSLPAYLGENSWENMDNMVGDKI